MAARDHVVSYGDGSADDDALRLCGDVSGGKRAIELGVSTNANALAFALGGAKAIAVDPDAGRIDDLRRRAAELDVIVECHQGDLADLGFATSGSVEVVVADHTLDEVDDLGRVLRQVHRVLRVGQSFVIALDHPFAPTFDTITAGEPVTPYGSATRTFGDWFVALSRANFRVDTIHELGVGPRRPVPTTLVLRARKEGS
jgi:SAM-dependent methyltransferase